MQHKRWNIPPASVAATALTASAAAFRVCHTFETSRPCNCGQHIVSTAHDADHSQHAIHDSARMARELTHALPLRRAGTPPPFAHRHYRHLAKPHVRKLHVCAARSYHKYLPTSARACPRATSSHNAAGLCGWAGVAAARLQTCSCSSCVTSASAYFATGLSRAFVTLCVASW